MTCVFILRRLSAGLVQRDRQRPVARAGFRDGPVLSGRPAPDGRSGSGHAGGRPHASRPRRGGLVPLGQTQVSSGAGAAGRPAGRHRERTRAAGSRPKLTSSSSCPSGFAKGWSASGTWPVNFYGKLRWGILQWCQIGNFPLEPFLKALHYPLEYFAGSFNSHRILSYVTIKAVILPKGRRDSPLSPEKKKISPFVISSKNGLFFYQKHRLRTQKWRNKPCFSC